MKTALYYILSALFSIATVKYLVELFRTWNQTRLNSQADSDRRDRQIRQWLKIK